MWVVVRRGRVIYFKVEQDSDFKKPGHDKPAHNKGAKDNKKQYRPRGQKHSSDKLIRELQDENAKLLGAQDAYNDLMAQLKRKEKEAEAETDFYKFKSCNKGLPGPFRFRAPVRSTANLYNLGIRLIMVLLINLSFYDKLVTASTVVRAIFWDVMNLFLSPTLLGVQIGGNVFMLMIMVLVQYMFYRLIAHYMSAKYIRGYYWMEIKEMIESSPHDMRAECNAVSKLTKTDPLIARITFGYYLEFKLKYVKQVAYLTLAIIWLIWASGSSTYDCSNITIMRCENSRFGYRPYDRLCEKGSKESIKRYSRQMYIDCDDIDCREDLLVEEEVIVRCEVNPVLYYLAIFLALTCMAILIMYVMKVHTISVRGLPKLKIHGTISLELLSQYLQNQVTSAYGSFTDKNARLSNMINHYHGVNIPRDQFLYNAGVGIVNLTARIARVLALDSTYDYDFSDGNFR